MNPFNYSSGPTLTSHSNHIISFHEMKYIQMWDDAAPVIRTERVSHLPYNINNHNFIIIKRIFYPCIDRRNTGVRETDTVKERERGGERERQSE
jgi:hypothetical protein